jgi:hypothetical protein
MWVDDYFSLLDFRCMFQLCCSTSSPEWRWKSQRTWRKRSNYGGCLQRYDQAECSSCNTATSLYRVSLLCRVRKTPECLLLFSLQLTSEINLMINNWLRVSCCLPHRPISMNCSLSTDVAFNVFSNAEKYFKWAFDFIFKCVPKNFRTFIDRTMAYCW